VHNVVIDGRLIGYRYGGIASYARQLATRIPQLSQTLEMRVAVRRIVPELSDRALRVLTPPHHRYERLLFGAEMMAYRPDLLHSVDYVTPKTRGIRTVATVHDLAFLEHPHLVTEASHAYYSQIKSSLPEVERVIVVSPNTRERLLAAFNIPEERVVTIPNGYDDSLFQPECKGDLELIGTRSPILHEAIRSHRPVVLSVGTLEPRKRFEILLDVLEQQWEETTRIVGTTPVFVIAGQTGWLSDHLVSRIRRQASFDRLVWIRDCTDQELAALYRLAELLVVPSLDEGFGLPVLEAMASGTPSLVANTGALPWLVAECGFIEDTDVPAAWAEKIGMILADSDIRMRRRERGLKRAKVFTWDETARKTARVYEEVLNGR
jgi:glycosyltransferase involved in cell wall biosynthesis